MRQIKEILFFKQAEYNDENLLLIKFQGVSLIINQIIFTINRFFVKSMKC